MTTPEKKTPPPIPPREVVLVLRLARKQRKKDEKLKKQLRKTEPRIETAPPEVIERFSKRYRFLGNFFPAFVVCEGIRYPSSEHAYQAAKFDDIETKKRIAAIEDSAEAKHFAHNAGPIRSDWEKRKVDVMREVVFVKFSPNRDLKDRLLQTGNAVLEEGNRHGDSFWGTIDGIGENMLEKFSWKFENTIRGM